MLLGALSLSCASGTTSPDDPATTTGPTGDSTSEPDTCLVEGEPSLQVGTGVDAFEALSELDEVEVVFGPQGGYHVVTAVRVCHMEPLVTVRVQVIDEASSVAVADTSYLAPTLDAGGCCRERADMYGYLDVGGVPGVGTQSPGDYLDEEVLVIELSASDELGNEASGAVRVRARSVGR